MKAEIDVDMYIDVESSGIKYGLYFGDSCEPACETVESWEDIVKRTVEYHIIPLSETLDPYGKEELEKVASGLENFANLIRKEIKTYQ